MKKNILTLTVVTAMSILSLNTFGQQDKKSEKARKNLAEAKKDLKEAKTDSVVDYLEFKKEAEMNIAENKKKISDLRTKKNESIKEEQLNYDKKVLILEQKNEELAQKINGSGTTKTTMWTAFKEEFRRDMKALGSSISNIGTNNEK